MRWHGSNWPWLVFGVVVFAIFAFGRGGAVGAIAGPATIFDWTALHKREPRRASSEPMRDHYRRLAMLGRCGRRIRNRAFSPPPDTRVMSGKRAAAAIVTAADQGGLAARRRQERTRNEPGNFNRGERYGVGQGRLLRR